MNTRARVLADSSIWIDHLSYGHEALANELKARTVVMHPMVIAEVALGSIANREAVIHELSILPQTATVPHAELMAMITWLKFAGCGIGFVDTHLLAATRQIVGGRLLTRDKALHRQAERLGVAFAE